jgi:hypothetical protein
VCEPDAVGLSFFFEMFESLHYTRKASIASADTSSHVAHLDHTARALPRKQFGGDLFHTVAFFFEDETVFFKGSMGVDEAEIEIESEDVVS